MFAICYPSDAADDQSVEAALKGYEAAVSSITSFDVFIQVDRIFRSKAVQDGVQIVRGTTRPKFALQKLDPPVRTTSFSRQVFAKDGRRRYEQIPDFNGPWIEAKVFTGEVSRTFSNKTNSGVVTAEGPGQLLYEPVDEGYISLYREIAHGGDYLKLFRSRSNVRIAQVQGNSEMLIVIEAPPDEASQMYPRSGFRVRLDPAHGMMPKVIEVFARSMSDLFSRCEIVEFMEIEPRVWVPIEANIDFGGDDLSPTVTLRVDPERSRWNQQIEDAVFTLPYPEGALVLDKTREMAVVVGKGDAGDHINDLVERAKSIVPTENRPVHRSGRDQSYALLGAAVALVGLLLFLLYRVRRGPVSSR